jgi:hypothetical protein
MKITKRQLRRIIREAYKDPYGFTHPHKLSGGDAPDLKHLENILHGINWGDFYEHPDSYKFKNARDARDKAQKISKQLAAEGQAEDVLAAWKKYAIGAENFIEKLEHFIKNGEWRQQMW